MSTSHFRIAVLAVVFACLPALAAAATLKPWKDELFSTQIVLDSRDGGDFEVIDYQELRDINARDQEPERRVRQKYVSLGVRKHQANETLALPTGSLPVLRVGEARGATFTVVFIHGRGGDRRLGGNDFSFGGNFNRLKNLAVDNGGAYYAPSVPSFDAAGVDAVAALIAYATAASPGRPVVVACASMGSFICSGLSRRADVVANLAGMMILGGAPDPDLSASALRKVGLPLYLSHGSNDAVYAAKEQIALYETLHKAGHPVRFTLFNTGGHGTPVRMTDWRKALNWLLAAR